MESICRLSKEHIQEKHCDPNKKAVVELKHKPYHDMILHTTMSIKAYKSLKTEKQGDKRIQCLCKNILSRSLRIAHSQSWRTTQKYIQIRCDCPPAVCVGLCRCFICSWERLQLIQFTEQHRLPLDLNLLILLQHRALTLFALQPLNLPQ